MSANSASFGSVFSERLHLLHSCGASSCLFCDHLSCGNQKDSSSCSGFGNYSVRVCVYTAFASWHFPVGWAEHVAVFLESWPVSVHLRVTVQPSWRPRGAAAFFLPPSAVFHLRAHNCLARPTAALQPKQTQCIKKKILQSSSSSSRESRGPSQKLFYWSFSAALVSNDCFNSSFTQCEGLLCHKVFNSVFPKNTIMWKGKTLNIFSIYS